MRDEKLQYLEDNNYIYNFNRNIYVNIEKKKIFSEIFINDHDLQKIITCHNKNNNDVEFYTNEKIDSITKEETIREYNL